MMTKLNDLLKRYEDWRPLIIALSIIVVIAISHKIYWETLEETEVLRITKEDMLSWMDKYTQAQKHLYQYIPYYLI